MLISHRIIVNNGLPRTPPNNGLPEMLNRIKESLTRYFSADRSDFPEGFRDIESDYNQLPGEPYPTIAINDVGNANRMIEFYVTGKQYDVYHVAFKGFTKG